MSFLFFFEKDNATENDENRGGNANERGLDRGGMEYALVEKEKSNNGT